MNSYSVTVGNRSHLVELTCVFVPHLFEGLAEGLKPIFFKGLDSDQLR
jgi:hypothetical protein